MNAAVNAVPAEAAAGGKAKQTVQPDTTEMSNSIGLVGAYLQVLADALTAGKRPDGPDTVEISRPALSVVMWDLAERCEGLATAVGRMPMPRPRQV